MSDWAAWAKATFGCETCRCAPSEFPGYGQGMAALEPIKKGECVVRVPLTRCLTSADALLAPALEPVLRELPEEVCDSSEMLLALLLLAGRKPETDMEPHLKAYAGLLPSAPESLFAWTQEELTMLRGSKWAMVVEANREEMQQEFDALKEVVGAELLQAVGADLAGYQWAQGIINSRSVRFFTGRSQEPIQVLVPVQDLFNKSIEASDIETVRLEVNHGDPASGTVAVYAARDYNVNEQVFTSCIAAQNGRLLLHGGFILPDNPDDSVELVLTLPSSTEALPLYEKLIEACKMPDLRPGQAVTGDLLEKWSFVELPSPEVRDVLVHFRMTLKQPLGEDHLLSFLRLGTLPAASLTPDIAAQVLQGKPISPAHELKTLKMLRDGIDAMLAGYDRPLKEDEDALLKLPSGPDRLRSREAQALVLVATEKRIFLAALSALDILLEDLRVEVEGKRDT